jgi:hypothetical protein
MGLTGFNLARRNEQEAAASVAASFCTQPAPTVEEPACPMPVAVPEPVPAVEQEPVKPKRRRRKVDLTDDG